MKEFKNELVSEIKKNFNLKQDNNVGKIASFIIGYDVNRRLTNNQIGHLVVELKNEVGLECGCNGDCIAYYRNKLKNGKMKKVESIEERKIRLEKELESINNKLNSSEK